MAASLFLCVSLLIVQTTDAYRAEIERYRSKRIQELAADDGWLTVAGLFWLKPGTNTVGGAPDNDIVLPLDGVARLGAFELTNGQVAFTAAAGSPVTSGGTPVTTRAMDPRGGDKDALAIGALRLFVIRRGDRFGVRVRNLDSEARTAFAGLRYFPLRPEYRVSATFMPYDTPRRVPIPNVLGQSSAMESPGYVTFELNGRTLRLEPVYETEERRDLFFIFRDLTSRDATYPAGRFLHTPLPANGKVDLDFNRAYNPPCAFTDFATCPLPPKQNHLPVRIEAGELVYHVKK